MKKVLTAAAAVMLVLGATGAQAHDPAAERANWLTERLDLTEEQQAEASAIFAEAQEQRKALRAQAREQRKAAVERRRALREQSKAIARNTQERLSGVLTEEQQAQLGEMRKDMKKHAIMRGEIRGSDLQQRHMHGEGWRRGMGQKRERVLRMMHLERQASEQAEAPAAEE